jgi:hypothetical protein
MNQILVGDDITLNWDKVTFVETDWQESRGFDGVTRTRTGVKIHFVSGESYIASHEQWECLKMQLQ